MRTIKFKNLFCSLIIFFSFVQFLFVSKCKGEFFDLKDFFEEFSSSDETRIENEVKVITNTGENQKTDKNTSQVFIKNIVNGKEIDPLNSKTKGKVEVKSEIKTEKGKILIKREVQTETGNEVQEYQIESKENQKEKGKLKEIWKNLERFFETLFQNLQHLFFNFLSL